MENVSRKVSYLQNSDYPMPDEENTNNFTHNLVPINDDICQIRLDFLLFDLSPQCDNKGQFRIKDREGKMLPVGDLCGQNMGQHLYIPVENTTEMVASIEINAMGMLNGST